MKEISEKRNPLYPGSQPENFHSSAQFILACLMWQGIWFLMCLVTIVFLMLIFNDFNVCLVSIGSQFFLDFFHCFSCLSTIVLYVYLQLFLIFIINCFSCGKSHWFFMVFFNDFLCLSARIFHVQLFFMFIFNGFSYILVQRIYIFFIGIVSIVSHGYLPIIFHVYL